MIEPDIPRTTSNEGCACDGNSAEGQKVYPIRDGIPIMLIDEARPFDDGRERAKEGTGQPVPPASAKPEPGST